MKIFTVADNIISPLGFTTSDNVAALANGKTGVSAISDNSLYPESFIGAQLNRALVNEAFDFDEPGNYSFLEQLFILSIKAVLQKVPGLNKNRTLLLISTTKGNIDQLGNNDSGSNYSLPAMAHKLNAYFGFTSAPLIVSNACISGVSAILVAEKLIRMGLYDHVLVTGGDMLSEFVVSGFQCLKAISDKPCKPYDADRNGINLGEACGTILLSNDRELCQENESLAVVSGGGQTNDANHISGPSRTGKGLKLAVKRALKHAGINQQELAYISAHGTATVYNDEMEAIAFSDMDMQDIPLNSLKGYFGHTLGAAGVIESIMTIRQLNNGVLFKSIGYEASGVSKNINVLADQVKINTPAFALKTVSGFGGCNAAVVFGKA